MNTRLKTYHYLPYRLLWTPQTSWKRGLEVSVLCNVKTVPLVAESVQQMSSVHKSNVSRSGCGKIVLVIFFKIGDSTQTIIAALVYGKNNNWPLLNLRKSSRPLYLFTGKESLFDHAVPIGTARPITILLNLQKITKWPGCSKLMVALLGLRSHSVNTN